MQSNAGDIGRRTLDVLVPQLELLAQIACRHTGMEATFLTWQQLFQTNPIAAPLRFTEQSDAEAFVAAPLRLSLIGEHPYTPRQELSAGKWFPAVGYP